MFLPMFLTGLRVPVFSLANVVRFFSGPSLNLCFYSQFYCIVDSFFNTVDNCGFNTLFLTFSLNPWILIAH